MKNIENAENFIKDGGKGERTEKEINLDDVAKKYAEGIRDAIRVEKEKKSDVHLESIDPNELTYDDLIIYDKFIKNNLSDSEFEDYRRKLQEYLDEQSEAKGGDFNVFEDSRSNLSAMILNKILAGKSRSKLFEKERRKPPRVE